MIDNVTKCQECVSLNEKLKQVLIERDEAVSCKVSLEAKLVSQDELFTSKILELEETIKTMSLQNLEHERRLQDGLNIPMDIQMEVPRICRDCRNLEGSKGKGDRITEFDINPRTNEKYSCCVRCRKRRDTLSLNKKKDQLKLLGKGQVQISQCKTQNEIQTLWSEICTRFPMNQLLESGSFYLAFARVDRATIEPFAFLQQRGGSYFSNSRDKMVVRSRSRPVLVKQDGGVVGKTELQNAGFECVCLHSERNHINVTLLEKHAQETIMHLPLGRRLNRNFCGGAKVKADKTHMEYGLYVVYNVQGISPFTLNE